MRIKQAAVGAIALAALAFGMAPMPASAAGFYVNEQSARGLGRGFAGEAALGGDASALWYNPAHAASFDRPTATGALSSVLSNGEIKNRGTTLQTPVSGGPQGVSGVNSDDPLEFAVVPQAGFVLPLGRNFAAGVSLNAPFGLVVTHPQNFFGRYDSSRTELLTANVQTTLAWRANPQWAFGAGLNVQYAEAALESALPNLAPVGDGFLQVTGDDWSLGWNVGALWTPTPQLQLGASYRSSVQHELEGEQRIRGLVGPLAGANREQVAAADLDLPDIAMAGIAYEIAPGWTTLAQVSWFGWSNFEEIRIEPTVGADLVRPQRYEDSIALHLGVERAVSPTLSYRAGLMLEETPSQPGFRSTRVPDSDRAWVTAGASWTPRENMTFDVGAAYVQLKELTIERTDFLYEGGPAESRLDLRSEIKGSAFIASVGASMRF